MSSRLPAHVHQALIDAGKLTGDGYGRTAKMRKHRACGQWVILGLDHPRCAASVMVDPACLDQRGEAVTLLAGRPTYELWGRELEHRTATKIRAGMHKPVLGEHVCNSAVIPTPEIVARFIPRKSPDIDTTERAPF